MKTSLLVINAVLSLIMVTAIALSSSCTPSSGSTPASQENKAKGFTVNIEKQTLDNKNFRKVLYTSKNMQLVLMSLRPNEDIGEEIHMTNDQFFRFEKGHGKCIINGNEYEVTDGDVIIVPAGAKHNVINLDDAAELKLYAIYSPPHHKDGIIHPTKKDAGSREEEFDGITTEPDLSKK